MEALATCAAAADLFWRGAWWSNPTSNVFRAKDTSGSDVLWAVLRRRGDSARAGWLVCRRVASDGRVGGLRNCERIAADLPVGRFIAAKDAGCARILWHRRVQSAAVRAHGASG